MKTINLLLILLLPLPLCLGSCAPKVITDLVKSVTADEVRLYGMGHSVPELAEFIGNVKVVDGGVSTKCNYDQVVALAKQETTKKGENALALTDHRKPSLLGSSCHQIAGNMLWIGDTVNVTGEETYSVPVPINSENMSHAETSKSPFQHSTFYANIGYAFMTNKFYLPKGASGHPMKGMDWQVGYDWVSRSGFGAGLMYSGYKSFYSYSHVDVNVGLAYIAPQFVMKSI